MTDRKFELKELDIKIIRKLEALEGLEDKFKDVSIDQFTELSMEIALLKKEYKKMEAM